MISYYSIDHCPFLLNSSFTLRYRVYCEEKKFLSPSDYGSGLETDKYDKFSIHFGAFDTKSNMVGTVRLVLPTVKSLPIKKYMPNINLLDKESSGEISRLVINNSYRKPLGKRSMKFLQQCSSHKSSNMHLSYDKKFNFFQSVIGFGLFRSIVAASRSLGIRYLYAGMDEKMWQMLSKMNMPFSIAGAPGDYMGIVTPCVCDINNLDHNIWVK